MTITLYHVPTPNGVKISIALELLKLPYKLYKIDMRNNEQKQPWYLKINPNGRIPAIVDSQGPARNGLDGFPVFESGAILLYLAEKYDPDHSISFEYGTTEYWEQLQWLFFQNAGVGPMQGQLEHFSTYASEKIEYAVGRYSNETRRLYSVLETRLEHNGKYLVGNHLSLADIATIGWVGVAFHDHIDLEKEFPHLYAWLKNVVSIEGVKNGLNTSREWGGWAQFK